jgi:hypothetical protein
LAQLVQSSANGLVNLFYKIRSEIISGRCDVLLTQNGSCVGSNTGTRKAANNYQIVKDQILPKVDRQTFKRDVPVNQMLTVAPRFKPADYAAF